MVKKKCVVENGKVINIGDWDCQYVDIVKEPAVVDEYGSIIKEAVMEKQITNPFPEGATVEEREFEFHEDKGWVEVGTITTPTLEERLKATEDTLNFILGL